MCSDHSRKELWLIIFYYSPASERHCNDVNSFKKCRNAEKKKGFFSYCKISYLLLQKEHCSIYFPTGNIYISLGVHTSSSLW